LRDPGRSPGDRHSKAGAWEREEDGTPALAGEMTGRDTRPTEGELPPVDGGSEGGLAGNFGT